MVASIAQETSPCAQSARRQRPCCRLVRRCISSSKMNVRLTQVALVARPCAPAAQRIDESSSSSRRLAISLCPLRGHLELSKTAPSVCPVKNENASIKSIGQIESSWIKQHLTKLRSDSFQKFCSCFATAWIWKSSLRSRLFLPSRHFVAARWFSKLLGERAQRSKKFNSD